MNSNGVLLPWNNRGNCYENREETCSPCARWQGQKAHSGCRSPILESETGENPMTPLQRLQARIAELQAARDEVQSALDASPPAHTQPVSTVDWEARLSAARAVDTLTGANTAASIEAQRQAERLSAEKEAKKALADSLKATQQREALSTLDRDIEAATGLLARSIADAARQRLPDCERRYQEACSARLEAAADLAGWLSLCNRESEAHRLLREVGYAGDTLSAIARRTPALRAELLNEETENA